ncbi:MAG: terminase [Balneola sp.]|nr:terminase [Balneola sp.]|tara:strand:+ start:6464 stop:7909 length:1446 start_codon:yes stop_codon:yes gene_type:complete
MGAKKLEHNIVWQPHPGSQSQFMSCPIFECLYEGTRGPGKTDALLMDFLQHVGRGFGAEWRGILFRREYKELADVIKKSKKWYWQIFPNAKFLESPSELKWRFPDGEELLFRYAKKEEDYWDYHGHEYPWIGFEELTTWEDDNFYESMKSVCRSSHPGMPRKFRSTANPWGKGHHWVKKKFIDVGPAGTIATDEQGRKRVRIRGTIWENRHLLDNDPEYLKNIFGQKDENKRLAWAHGRWDIVGVGGFFSSFWDRDRQVIPYSKTPDGWKLYASFDWGSSKPASLGIWAVTDGTQIDGYGKFFPRGSVVRVDELYTVKKDKNGDVEPNTGLKYTAERVGKEIAKAYKRVEERHRLISSGVADPSIWAEDGGESIYDKIYRGAKEEGVILQWDRADNTRTTGWDTMKGFMEESLEDRAEKPGMWIMDNCRQFIRTVPVLQVSDRDPDDLDTDAEDHIADEARYFCMSAKTSKKVTKKKLQGF